MRFDILPQARLLIAATLFSVFLASCGKGEGPEAVQDPLFAECSARDAAAARCPLSGPPPGPGGGELLTNGDLESGQLPWINQAVVIDDGGNFVLQGEITAPDPAQPFLVNASQVVELTAGETYTLTFRAKASVNRSMIAGIGLNVGPFTNVVEVVPLTTDWQAYTYVLTANGFGGADSRVLFDMNGEAGDVFIDDVSLKTGSLLTNGDLEAGQAPWINQGVVVDDGGNLVLQGVVTAPDPGQPFLVNSSQVLDITAGEKYVLTFKARGSVDRSMIAGIGLNVGPFTNNIDTVALSTTYETFTCTLTAAGFGGADSRVLFDMNAEAGDVFIDDIALALLGPTGIPTVDGCAGGGGGGGGAGGPLLTNGDFEAGDLSSWDLAENGGTIAADNTQDSGSTWSVRLSAGPSQAPALSQTNLAVGTVSPGDLIDISFDMCGTLGGAGPVVFPALLSEFGIGAGADRQNLDTFVAVPSVWTRYNYQGIAGVDVTGGISIQFDVVCGGDPSCTAEVYFDNISATIGGGIVPGSASGNSCAAGGPGPGPGPGPLLVNGDFETDPVDKAPWINAGTVTTNNFYTVDAVDGGNVFDTNLSQVLDIINGSDYVLSFRARSTVDRSIVVGIGDSGPPFAAATTNAALTTEWQSFSFPLTAANAGGAASRVIFDMGTVASTVDIDDVSLELVAAPGVNLLTNGDFETDPADKAPWINAGAVTTNNFYTVDAVNGGNVFDTNLSQVLDITNGEDYILSFRARASVGRDIVVGIGDSGPPFAAALVTPNPTLTTEWQSFSFPLTAANAGGAASRVLFDLGTVASTVNIDDVTLVVDTGGGGPGPGPGPGPGGELAANGDFTNDFTGWTQIPSAQTTQTIVVDPTTSSKVARLLIPAVAGGVNNVLKQERLEQGNGVFNAGDTVRISFDYRGESGEGIMFVKSVCETSGAGICGDKIHSGGPFLGTPNWTPYSDTFVLGAGADAYTLEFAAVCGATGTCVADFFIDNVSITIE